MSLPPSFLDEIRARVPLSRVIGRKVTWDLRRSNQARGDWWAPCPFHGEKTASFHCDDQKGFYYCFGCHAKGDALTFLREADGLGFMEAVQLLAAEAGLAMPERSPQAQARSDRAGQLRDVLEQATRWFRMQLRAGTGAQARAYLAGRGLDEADWDRFEIGFAPDDRHALLTELRARGVDESLVVESGLAARPDNGSPYDRFRGRIIFPIRDAGGRAMAFGGRAMDPNARAKYLNSPETPLFDKGRNLYMLGPARAAVARGAPLVVAEGYMDVIALIRAGFEGAVAPLGTAITEDQLRLMWRVSPEPVIALDGDTAGLRAAMRLVDLALPMTGPGQALRFALMPPGQDPDDLLRAGGAQAMAAIIDKARPLVDLLWQRETEGKSFDSPERLAALDHALAQAVARIPDAATRGHYERALKTLKWQSFGRKPEPRPAPGRRGDRRAPRLDLPMPQTVASATAMQEEAGVALQEAVVLAICARHPQLADGIEARLERLHPTDRPRADLLYAILCGCMDPAAEAALETLMRNPHVRQAVAIANPEHPRAADLLRNALDRLEARRGSESEQARAERELSGDTADEGLTWRINQAHRARERAERVGFDAAADIGAEDASAAEALRAKAENEIWRRR